jgi:hypothetical protein
MIDVKSIKKNIFKIKQIDTNFSICGSKIYRYECDQTLTKEEINQIDNNIYLLDDYKVLLMKLENGGVGSGLGMGKISLDEINPPVPGTTFLLRNCKNLKNIDGHMLNVDEISGFKFCLIASGTEKGDLIHYDYNGRFQKLDLTLNTLYNDGEEDRLTTLKRVKQKLLNISLNKLKESKIQLINILPREMILSLINAKPNNSNTTSIEEYLQKVYKTWITKIKIYEAL